MKQLLRISYDLYNMVDGTTFINTKVIKFL